MIEGEEAGEDVLFGEVGGIFRPAVGGEDGAVEGAVSVGEPGGTLVIEVGEGALLQVGFGERIALSVFGVEPAIAKADEFSRGVGDSADDGGVGFGGFGAGWVGEGEGVEGGIGRVTEAALDFSQLRSLRSRPDLVNGGVKDT